MALSPEQQFAIVYKAKISTTGKQLAKLEPLTIFSYSNGPSNLDSYDFLKEEEIQILMSETEYNKFIKGYENYLDLVYGLQDPIARDMFEKLMMYIKLKK